ncbi:UDP-2,4-diacetamido-2,4,6-trideoxy-beta-L-altropyranose hydrolase [Asticcacaulis sp. BYS171W]|uniref:UDP-2,4-diacetamido-2,4, 6-trideoxy-beta-L-altropyranose hydrolase n=1 Tax=Asticcacaulis aquaticus TaxID=2984212 RepID=A0ABT5HRQ7_9CAUL|nr:UDP-2,4-diacetamido-2,4,6-trideoxy-beta-L-altropyranose hydrolase [Asticcacaulis aquaticus]
MVDRCVVDARARHRCHRTGALMRMWVRTEASTRIGLGHFMRCFAIAEEARHHEIEVVFLLNEAPDAAIARLQSIGAKWRWMETRIGSPENAAAIKTVVPKGDVLLLDSYAFDADSYDRLSADYYLAVMDDLAEVCPLKAHLIVNAAGSAVDLPYAEIAPDATLCLGPDYAQIRREFRRHYPAPRRPHICIMFGGSDPKGLTAICAEALLESAPAMDIRLIVGPANANVDALRQLCAKRAGLKLYLSPDNVAEVLTGAELVVTAAGGSVGEIAAMNLAALVMVVVDNQVAALKSSPFPVLDARKGWPTDFALTIEALMGDADMRREIAARAHGLIDGKGCERIIKAIRSHG